MTGLQIAIFNAMKADEELLRLLGFDPTAVTESEISERLLPAVPERLMPDVFIVFWQPMSNKSRRNFLFENRNIQFRIFMKDSSPETDDSPYSASSTIPQQLIADRLQFIFIGNETSGGKVKVDGTNGYEDFEYVGEGIIPGVLPSGHYGWFLELIFQNVVKYSR